jgi:hypothetical protein
VGEDTEVFVGLDVAKVRHAVAGEAKSDSLARSAPRRYQWAAW